MFICAFFLEKTIATINFVAADGDTERTAFHKRTYRSFAHREAVWIIRNYESASVYCVCGGICVQEVGRDK